jgi:DNA transformation protein and related proteins
MKEFEGERLYVALGTSQVRRQLKGHGFGVRMVYNDGKNRAVIIHTATGEDLRELEDFFREVLTTPLDNPRPCQDEDLEKE